MPAFVLTIAGVIINLNQRKNMKEREFVEFIYDGNTFKSYVEPTVRELNAIENKLIAFFGYDEYQKLMETIGELEKYQASKNEEVLTKEGYEKLKSDLGEFLKVEPPKEDDPKYKEYFEQYSSLIRKFYTDGKINHLNQLRNQISRAREICSTDVLTIGKPDKFDIYGLPVSEYNKLRESLEDSLNKFWLSKSDNEVKEVDKSNSK
jgi:hypothetical protein